MKHVKRIYVPYLIVLLLIVTGCKPNSGERKENESQKVPVESVEKAEPETTTPGMVYFKGSGNEPFWNVELNDQEIRFTSMIEGYEALSTPLPEMQRAADANVKRYRAETEKVTLTLTISQGACADTMADKSYPYKVTVLVMLTGEDTPKEVTGCGDYITDYRLNDQWVLEQLNDEMVREDQFANQLPFMEINTTANHFSGYAGCNQMQGDIFWEKGLLRFTKVITTRKACVPSNRESEFLDNLEKATSYSLENNRLTLSNPDGKLLVFKKTD